jgi:predicted DNA-binding transcriptional regulator AlpA
MPDTIIDDRQLELSGIGYDAFIRYHQLAQLGIPYSRQHLTVLEDRGEFPKRVKLSARVIAWRLSEIRNWMAKRSRRE